MISYNKNAYVYLKILSQSFNYLFWFWRTLYLTDFTQALIDSFMIEPPPKKIYTSAFG